MTSPGDGEDFQTVAVGGRRLKISNLDKVLYPATGTTKGEVISYYHQIGSIMLEHLRGRPVTRKRWVHGVGTESEPGTVFFQKNLDPHSTPEWVRRFPITHHDRTNNYPVADDLATLIWLAQLASLEIHVPQWRFAGDGTQQHPDRLVLDLDPGPGIGLPDCVAVARWADELLNGIGYQLYPVTSGSKGIHLYAQLDGKLSSEQASAVAKEVAETLQRQHPDLVTAQMSKDRRAGKVFIDWSQNNANKTTISPYSLRGRLHPTVAAPRRWDELDEDLEQLDFTQMLDRIDRIGDLLAPFAGGDSHDRLAEYRSKRDGGRTPEPVPATSDATQTAAPADCECRDDAPSFVIQEHHARRLHYDFRLERGGVLVSWAVPKGVPTDTGTNHLAVQTEDHPLEYGNFEGVIPSGEYGGGEVIIADSGSYELEKWRDGAEVIVTLHGRKPGGVGTGCKIALIHTGGRGGQPENHWLMHLMSGEPADPQPADESERRALQERAERELAGADEHASGDSVIWHSDRDSGAGTAEPFPDEVRPMLASAVDPDELPASPEWAYELKWDGVRAVCYLAGGRAKILSRRGLDVSASYPEVADALTEINVSNAILDGEIVAPDENGRPSFARLQQRMNLGQPAEIARVRRTAPVQLVLFDLLHRDDQSLIKHSYRQRRQELQGLTTGDDSAELAGTVGRIQIPPIFEGDLPGALDASHTLDAEGVVAKKLTSIYQPGSRGRTWLKIKNVRTQEVVIAGWRTGRGRRSDTVGSLVMAVPAGDESSAEQSSDGRPALRYVGRVGTGFSDAELDRLHHQFADLVIEHPKIADVPALDARDAHWIEPIWVGEVRYGEWTADHRLRFPVWRGWRPDKSPADIRVEG